jgi:hypothetical protein
MPPLDASAVLPVLENDWMQAWIRKDRATCEAILAEDFLLTSARRADAQGRLARRGDGPHRRHVVRMGGT